MDKFAKLFEIDEHQVLIYLTSNDKNVPCVKRITKLDGLEVAMNLCWERDNEESWRAARLAFEKQTESEARALLALSRSSLS